MSAPSNAEPRSDAILVSGRTLAFEEVGRGEAVLLVHSGGLSRRQWRRLRDALSPRYRVVVPDLLGYGDSSPWPSGEPFVLEQDLEALLALVDPIGAPVHLVGHSYGGLLALKLALAQPEGTRSLAAFEPVAFGVFDRASDPESWRRLDEISPVYQPDAQGADEAWLTAFIDWWNGPGAWRAMSEDARSDFRRVGWKVFQEVASLMKDRTPVGAYAAISAPCLLLFGERSPEPAHRVVERLAVALPRAESRRVDGVGHMAPVNAARAVNEAIVEHLARVA